MLTYNSSVTIFIYQDINSICTTVSRLVCEQRLPLFKFLWALFKVSNENTKTMCEICSKLKTKTPERCQCRCSGVFIVNFEQISHFFQVNAKLRYVSKLQISINYLTHLRTMFHSYRNQSIDLQIKWITLFLYDPNISLKW